MLVVSKTVAQTLDRAAKKCKHRCYGPRVSSWDCGKTAGHGPDGNYCKTHARLHEKIDATKVLWELKRGYGNGLPIQVKVREFNEKTFIDERGRRNSRSTQYSDFYETREQAINESLVKAKKRIEYAQAEIKEQQSLIDKLKSSL